MTTLSLFRSILRYSCSANKCEQQENGLYSDFALAANIALRCLESLEVQGIRRQDTSRIYFHTSDPSTLMQEHRGKALKCKPDLVLVSVDDVRGTCGSEGEGRDYLPEDLFLNKAAKVPAISFKWRVIRTFVECKTSKAIMAKPLSWYAHEPKIQNPECKYPTKDDEPVLAQSITSVSPVSSNTGSQRPEASKWVFCSAT
jgi:hypothetical protein